jgi:O-antigen/teichoic acid export membrane protein
VQDLRSRALVRNASSLFGATTITSLLGFVFWAVAARLAPTSQVGTASAAVAGMQLCGTLATLGLGTLLLGELARRPAHRFRLVGSALAISGSAGVLGGVVTAVVLTTSTTDSLPGEGLAAAALFVAGCAFTALTAVLDQALIGLGKSGPQLTRNVVFSVVKLALLPAMALVVPLTAVQIYAAWLLGHVVSLVLLGVRVSRGVWRQLLAPGMSLRGLGRSALAHHVTNTASHAPLLVLPVVVMARLGAESNAAFYAATLLASSLWVIPSHLSTALFATAGVDPSSFGRELRLSLRVSAAVSCLAIGVGAPLAGVLLSLFGPEYRQASTGLVMLLLATPAFAVKALYIAVCRAQGRLGLGATVTLWGSVLEVVAGAWGTAFGLTGVCAAFGAALLIEAVVFWPRLAQEGGLPTWGRRRSADSITPGLTPAAETEASA